MDELEPIQIVLEYNRDESIILSAISSSIGFIVDSVDHPVNGALGSILSIDFTEGFERQILICWPPTIEVTTDRKDIATQLAAKLDVALLLENGPEDTDWLHITPEGIVSRVEIVDMNDGVTYRKL